MTAEPEKLEAGEIAASEVSRDVTGTLEQMRGMSLSDTDLSNAKVDLDHHMSYHYMVSHMTTSPDGVVDELLCNYVTTLARFSGIQIPPYMIEALREVSSIAKQTEQSVFANFMEKTLKKMADVGVRQDGARYYKHLGRNLCHIGTMLRTLAMMMPNAKNSGVPQTEVDTSDEEAEGTKSKEGEPAEPAAEVPAAEKAE